MNNLEKVSYISYLKSKYINGNNWSEITGANLSKWEITGANLSGNNWYQPFKINYIQKNSQLTFELLNL